MKKVLGRTGYAIIYVANRSKNHQSSEVLPVKDFTGLRHKGTL